MNSIHSPLPQPLTRWLWLVAILSLGVRVWVSATLPMTGDEALFYWWARFLDYGYYDHPPMAAWWIAATRFLFGDGLVAVRLTASLLPIGVGAAIWWAWYPQDRERAAWAVLLFWLMPVNWLGALVTTDTPLIFWAAWSAAAMVRAEAKTSQLGDRGQAAWGLYALSGAFMALAFLSKYFAVLLGVAYAVYFAIFRRQNWRGFLWMVVAALPGLVVNMLWNLNHCWTNIMFNVFNRNQDAVFSWGNPLAYVGMMIYLISPVILWFAWRHRELLKSVFKHQALVTCMALVPLLCFGLMSGKKVIGLHWVLGFYPFLFVLIAWALPKAQMGRVVRALSVFLAIHLALVAGVAMTRLDQWHGFKHFHRLVEAARASQIVEQAKHIGGSDDAVLMATAYSSASIYGYALGQHVPVFGVGSFHARQDDLIVDYARFDGKKLRIITGSKPNLDDYAPFFEYVSDVVVNQDGVPFHVVEGSRFNYQAYRERVMAQINQSFYRFPAWLPVRHCSFCERFCGAARCTP